MVRRRREQQTFLVPRQDVGRHDEEDDGHAEEDTVEAELAEAAQACAAPRGLSLHLQDGEETDGRLVHLQQQRTLPAVVVGGGAQQAVSVVHGVGHSVWGHGAGSGSVHGPRGGGGRGR